MKTITWLSPQDAPEWFPPARAGAARSPPGCWPPAATCRRSACWPPTGAASFPGTRPGSRSCGGRRIRARCCSRRNSTARAASRKTLRNGGFTLARRPRLRRGHRWLRRAARGQSRHLDHRRDARGLPASCTAWASPTASRPGAAARSSAACTGCASAGCSSANPCSAASATPPRSRSRTWSTVCRRNSIAVIDCQLPSQHLASLGVRTIPRTQFQALLREHVAAAAPALVAP